MKKLSLFLTSATLYLTLPGLAFAESAINPCQANTAATTSSNGAFSILCALGMNVTGATSVGGVLGAVITMMFIVAAIIALWFLVQGGIRWITSQGDTKNVEGARNQIIAAAVGLAVTFLAYLIINILLQFFIGTSLNGISIPQIGK